MIVTKDFPFIPANSSRTLHIYLPDDYYQSQEAYPCMYYFDGQNLFFDYEASFGTSWGLKDFLDVWPKKMIVVGIECSHQGNQRLAEYSPYSFFEEPFGQIEAYGKETLNWLVSELKPYIDQKFRTYPFREATGIAGSSMGGLMAAYAGIAFNNYFSKMACLSSALSFNFEELMTDLSKQELNADSRFYLSVGQLEAQANQNQLDPFQTPAVKRNLSLEAALQAKGAQTYFYLQEYGQHNEASWQEQNQRYLEFLWF